MKEELRQIVATGRGVAQGRNLTREYVQARILASLQRSGAMVPLAFHGGTALRFLFSLPRYSEDLDFALEHRERHFALRSCVRAAAADLRVEGYVVTAKISDRRTVHSSFVSFPGLLHELGLSPRPAETLSVKIEVDTKPPAGATLTTTLVRRQALLHLQHHDRASLLAGKLHAVLQRPYLKGRDLFDLLWYLADRTWPEPNLELLNNALRQTGWRAGELCAASWKAAVRRRIAEASFEKVAADVQPFLEPGAGLELLTRQNVLRVLE